MSIDAAARSCARVSSSWVASPRIAAIQVCPPTNRWDFTVPPWAEASSAPAASRAMWQSMQVLVSTLSTRPAPLPVHAELRHAVGSSMPEMCTGRPRSGDRKPR